MPDVTETGQAFDVRGRRVVIGPQPNAAVYLETARDKYVFAGAELDKLREAIDRAAMPGQARDG